MELIVMLVGFGALMYFFMIRPQQKRMKEHQSLVNSLSPGARVMLNSGMFATVRHMGQQQAIVELAPGVEITITNNSVARFVGDNDEEFEFSEDA